MKKHDRLHRLSVKLWLFLAAFLVFAFFSNDFGLVDIQKTAVILAAGIDKGEDGYTLTAHIAVPKGSDRSKGGTSSVNIKGRGDTISACISDIYADTGWVPKLVFCDLLLLGEEAVQENSFLVLDYFLRNEQMPDSCQIAVCEGSAEEMLSSASAIDDTSALAIEKLLSDAAEKTGQLTRTTLREFSIGYYGVSESGKMPYLGSKTQSGAESAQGGAQAQDASGGAQSGDEKIYEVRGSALFSQGRMVALLSPDETFAYSLLQGEVRSGTFLAHENGEAVTLYVYKNKGSVSLSLGDVPEAALEVVLRVRVADRDGATDVSDLTSSIPSDALLQDATAVITQAISSLWARIGESECDLFQLRQQLFRHHRGEYELWRERLLSVARPNISVTIRPVE